MNKKKIINDPVYGFVTIPSEFIYDLIQHPFMQRLRYIKQVSMTHLVYPGALHTRFQHAIGATHLTLQAVDTLRGKGINISHDEAEAVAAATLLHDIGHGPFSHSLEKTLIDSVSHEMISEILMDQLNKQFEGKLSMAVEIFKNEYHRKFFHQLVSSQLDTDRMDYLTRDSFFTGVSEGVISFDRIITMFNVRDDELVIDQKGIYSVEKFLIARRLMYWQVYLHKTVVAAEQMLLKALKRAKFLSNAGIRLFATPSLHHFLVTEVNAQNFLTDPQHLYWFAKLDDTDIMSAIKVWADHEDYILSTLCQRILNRNLFRTEIRNQDFSLEEIAEKRVRAQLTFNISEQETEYFVYHETLDNSAYDIHNSKIKILAGDGEIKDITEASDLSNLETLSKQVRKYALIYPKELVKHKKQNTD